MAISLKIKQLLAHSGFQKYGENTSWLLAERLLRMAMGFFIGVWVARYLGPEKLGILSFAQSYIALFSAFATLGLDSIVVRELVKNKNKKEVLLGTSFLLKLCSSCTVVLIIYISLMFQQQDSDTNMIIIILSCSMIFQSVNVIDFYFQSEVKSKFVVFGNIISLILSSIIKVYLIINEYPLIYFAFVTVFEFFCISILMVYFYLKQRVGLSWSFNFDMAKFLLRESWPLIFSGVLISIYMRIDQVMIDNMLGSSEVGIYSAAVRLSELWYFIPMVICSSLFPAIMNAKEVSCKLYQERMKRLYFSMFWVSFLIAILLTFCSDFIVNTLYGIEFNESAVILTVHIWTSIFVFIGVANSSYLLSEGLQKYGMLGTLMGAITNIILNYILINEFGVVGAAYATLISQFVSSYLYLCLFRKTRISFINITRSIVYK